MSSLRDVAERCDVSVATVSRVLNNVGGKAFSAATAERVHKAAEEVGYRPNLLMRGVAGRSTRTIGVVVPPKGFHSSMVEGIHDRLAEDGYAIMLSWNKEHIAGPDSKVELEHVHRLLDRRVDGIILRPTHDEVSDLYFNEVSERGIPVVAIDRHLPHVHRDFVGTDDEAVGRLAAEHLLDLGHRHLLHLAGPSSVSTARDRRKGFEQAVAAFGDGADCTVIDGGGFNPRPEVATEALRSAPHVTAVFAVNDLGGAMMYQAAAELGLSIPGDLSVIGCGNVDETQWLRPGLSTFDQNPAEIGKQAAELLLIRLRTNRKNETPSDVRLAPEWVERESTAPPGPRDK